jgi:LysM repeat protein/ABC-type branched-subunit amino acid transport system substrate-binding protein
MKFLYYFLVILLSAGLPHKSEGQMLKENELVVIGGEKYVLHHVRTGETIYSIGRQYQVTEQILSEYNPNLSEGLKIGAVLKIPYRDGAEWQRPETQKKGDPDYFESYTISSRTETPYFIAREFGITIEEIYAYNPEITRFRKGTRLRIPRWGTSPASIAADALGKETVGITERDLVLYEVQPGETLKSIARQFKLSESEILFFNPGARELKSGSVIHLPRPVDESAKEELAARLKEADSNYAGGAAFFEHTIVSGETLWSLTRKYNVSEFDLRKLNPLLETGFPAGVTIRVPVNKSELATAEPVNKEAFLKHEVKAGETLFGLSSKYNLTIPDIRRFNPQLENRNLVQGETLLIPKEKDEVTAAVKEEPIDSLRAVLPKFESRYYEVEMPVVIPENCRAEGHGLRIASTYHVALFLPLFIEANEELNSDLIKVELPADTLAFDELYLDEDTLVEMDEPEELFYSFYRDSENYLQFYEGVLLAVDSLKRAGMQIVLHVFDSQQNADSIRKYIYSSFFLETDLIIGPVFPNVQDEVAAIAAKNRIPIVSPLSAQSRVLNSNPYYFQINPSRDFLIYKTAELIAEEYFNSNFVVIKTSHSANTDERKVVDIVREKLTPSGYWNNQGGLLYKEVNFNRDGVNGLRQALSKEKENVIFVSSMNEGDLSVVLSNVNNIARNYPVTLIGFNRYDQFHSIQVEFYHNLRLQYLAPYWVDYSHPETIKFLEKFRRYYHTDPGNYGMQGYDVAFYFLNALKNFGKDFEECLPYLQVHLAQGSYQFEKQSAFGGYMNQGVSVISYEPGFDVVRKRVIGPYRFAQR